MKRKGIISAVVIAVLVGVIACSIFVFKSKNNSEPAKIIVATDTHYLSPSLTDHGKVFWKTINNADGKVIQYIDEILSAFSEEVIKAAPDVLILSGDLVFNGEKASHKDLAKKLSVIQKSGVQVLVIPGNHDINRSSAASLIGEEYEYVDSVSPEEFKEIYYDFGMKQAESVDAYSLSYLYKVNSDLCVLMLDTNAYGANYVQERSFDWIEEQLQKAKNEHMKVLTVSHQNLFAHNELLSFGYQLYNADKLLELLNQYKVKLNLSGHIHMQHSQKDGITEITTTALAVSPHQYGVIDFNGRSFNYSATPIDVSGWAKKKNIDDENLLQFESYSEDFFKNKTRTSDKYDEMDISDTEKALLAETFAEINANYFAGIPTDLEKHKEGIELWKKHEDEFTLNYLNSMLEDADTDYRNITVAK